MNIGFLNFDPRSSSGPNSFGSRLGKELIKSGHNVFLGPTENNLIFIECLHEIPKGSKNILRLDGIWTKKDQIETHNKRIREHYESVDAVIWQSEYDRDLTIRLWGTPKRGVIISNGADNSKIEISKEIEEFRRSSSEIFVCSSNWHSQKRLKSNIDFYFNHRSPGSKLLVLGNNPDFFIKDPEVIYLGSRDHNFCSQIYSISDWMIHLAWRDHCPNVVVEALNRGCPVICSSSGGTKEIVKRNGIIVDDFKDKDIDETIFDYDLPPDLFVPRVDLKKIEIFESDIPTLEKSYKLYEELFKEVFS